MLQRMSLLWTTASDVALQANVGLLVNCGSGLRVLESSKMTLNRHEQPNFV
jgi:hypothetical protein